jgi:hypothetical protein
MTKSEKKDPQQVVPPPVSENKEEDSHIASQKRSNPRKYLLYRPTFAQLMLYIATCFKDINENSALLLYVSADGSKRLSHNSENGKQSIIIAYLGGISTAVNYVRAKAPERVDADQNSLTHTLHPQDLIPFTRKAMFVIIDSNNSVAFKDFPKVFDQPFTCLMSPIEYPSSIKDTTQVGSLFSLFLHCPVKAFAFISELTQMSESVWNQLVEDLSLLEKHIVTVLENDTTLGKMNLI